MTHRKARLLFLLATLLPLGMTAAPKILVRTAEFDFGECPNTQTVTHDFVLTNGGDEPLKILGVHTTCGCTVAQPDADTIPPGHKTTLHVSLDLSGRAGIQHKTVTVHTNDPQQPRFRLAMKGIAKKIVEITPRVVAFGRVTGTVRETKQITLHIFDTEARFEIAGLTGPDRGAFTAELATADHDTVQEIDVHMKPGLPPGVYRAELQVRNTHLQGSTHTVRIYAHVLDELTVTPAELVIPANGEKSTRNIMISAGKTKRFKVLEIIPPARDVETEIINRAEDHCLIRVRELRGSEALRGRALVIRTDAPNMPEIYVPVRLVDRDF
ncbi:MAG: DUF1573 domain-containing protein [Candidatus Pacebacteria bacterium]|nr:DUF1573 domain-containing protein [Candidatus Paceibacterota bacterium]